MDRPNSSLKAQKHPYSYAGFAIRSTSAAIDSVLTMLLCFPLALFANSTGPIEIILYMNASPWSLLMQFIYYGAFLSSSWQATPGKKWMGLLVINQESKRLSFISAGLRCTVGYFISVITIAGGFLIMFTIKKTALHDLLFKSYVIHGEPEHPMEFNLKTLSKYKRIYEDKSDLL